MKILPIFLLLIVLFFTISGIIYFTKSILIHDTIVEILPGDTAREIAEKLNEHGVIRSPSWFYFYVKLTGIDKHLSRGKYLFFGKHSLFAVAEKIRKGEVVQKHITIQEGLTIKKTCLKLAKEGLGNYKNFLSLCRDSVFAKKLTGFSIPDLEGFLYPETYYFPEEVSEKFIIKHIVNQFFKATSKLNFNTPNNLDFYQTVILASIVEKEAKVNDEKPIIASVYLNRLQFKHRLQADPTIAYILEQQGKSRKRIFYKDLEIDSPYNTYKNFGLPPTPICSPSLSSIKAVLKPAETDYFFFFADKKGRHIFSKTYSQHLFKQRELKNGK